MSIDVDQLLQEVSEESPCGSDMEYDPVFQEMERASEGQPERQMGEETIPAQPPDWRTLRDKAAEVAGQSRDLRAAVHLTRALANLDGFPGLAAGLALVHGLIERHWAQVHPQLDPDDDNDPTMRINTLQALWSGRTMIPEITAIPVVHSRMLGNYSLHDMAVARGEALHVGEGEPPATATIDEAFAQAEIDELQATAEAVDRALALAGAIDVTLTEKLGTGQAPDASALGDAVGAAQRVMQEQLARRGVGEAPAAEEAAGGEAAAASGGQQISGEVQSRQDVIRILDKACEYYDRNEPSSPVPLLLQRAKRLAAMNFMEIMRDMAPEGLTQAETVSGVRLDEEEG